MSGSWSNSYQTIITLPTGAVSGTRIVLDGASDVILIYNAADELAISISPTSGTDSYGNDWVAGVACYDAGDATTVMTMDDSSYGSGFWTQGFNAGDDVYSMLRGGLLKYNAVDEDSTLDESGIVEWVFSSVGEQYCVMRLSSGAYSSTDESARIDLNPSSTLYAKPTVRVYNSHGAAVDFTVSGNVEIDGQITNYNENEFLTYTPTVTGEGTATFTTQTGWYQIIGDMVFFTAYLVVNGAGSGASNVTIDAPLSIDRTTRQAVSVSLEGLSTGNGAGQLVAFTSGTTVTWDRLRSSTGTNITGANLSSGALITAEGWYRTT